MFLHILGGRKQLINGKSLLDWSALFLKHMQTIDGQFDPGHRIDHVLRVTKIALELAQKEGASLEVILPAVILHDTQPIGKFDKKRADASALSAEHSIKLLESWGYPSQYYPAIKHAILAHSFSARVTPESLEAKIVQDADRLDGLGAIGIARTMAVGFKHGNPLYNHVEPFPYHRGANDQTNILDHFYIKLFSLQKSFNTVTAKEEGKRRIAAMEVYLQELAREIGVPYLSYAVYCWLRAMRSDFICAGTLGVTTKEGIAQMINAGYNHYDLATAYKGIHQALAEAMKGQQRSAFRICTKINDGDLIDNNFSVRAIVKKILAELNTTYVDTLMLHSPALLLHDRAVEIFDELLQLKEEGVINNIGVSNFTVKDLLRLDSAYLKHISYNQIEISPFCQQNDVVEFCSKNQIKVMAYRPFGKGKNEGMLEHSVLKDIAKEHGVDVHQVILAWIMQKRIMAIPKASNKEHLDSNMSACNIQLTSANMLAIARLDKNLHTCNWDRFVKLSDFKTFMDKPLIKPVTEQQRKFESLLAQLTMIINELESKNEEDPSKYNSVWNKACGLKEQLSEAGDQFFSHSLVTPKRIEHFKTACHSAIAEAEIEFKQHRNFWNQMHPLIRQILGIIATITILPGILVAQALEPFSTQGYYDTFFGTPQTTSAMKLAEIQSEFAVIESELDKGAMAP